MSLQEPPPAPGQGPDTLLLTQAVIGAVPQDGDRGLPHLREHLDQTVRLVSGAAPDLAGEFHALIHEVRFFEGASPSLSSTRTFGTVFIAAPSADRHPVRYLLDHLTREVSHHLLFALADVDALLDPGHPTRAGQRPLHEYVHQVFVLARLIHLWHALADQGETWAARCLHTDSRRFTEAARTVTDSAALTASGRSLLDSCVRLAGRT
nr:MULTISPECIES: HEXXH motif-containing putative peptide modification protein [unclassified Streptomyces]